MQHDADKRIASDVYIYIECQQCFAEEFAKVLH
jgi:hypothetical protein